MDQQRQSERAGWFARLKQWLRRAIGRVFPTSSEPPVQTAPAPGDHGVQVLRSRGRASAPDGRLRMVPWMPPARDYLLLRPSQPAPGMKLLVLIHGCKQHAEDFASATGARALVAGGQWAVVLPDQSKAANLYRCWNWFDNSSVNGRGEVAIVMAAIRQAREQLGDDKIPVTIAGLSSGAALTAAVVAHHPDQFEAAAFFAGLPMAATLSPMRARQAMQHGPDRDVTTDLPAHGELPSLVIQGDKDVTVNPVHADELIRQMLAVNGTLAPGEPLPAPGDDATHSFELPASQHPVIRTRFGNCERLIVQNMAHAWSGGDDHWKWFDSAGPDGLTLITRFVASHAGKAADEPDIPSPELSAHEGQ